MMGQHGFISWDDDEKIYYTRTLDVIERAAAFIEAKGGDAAAFGGTKYQTLPESERQTTLAAILPWLRGQVSAPKRFIGTVQDDANILRFVNSVDAPASPNSARPAPITSCTPRSNPFTWIGIRRPRMLTR